jgi:hypothetical protein
MTAKSNYLEDAIINHVLRATSLTSPGSNVWVALYTNSQGEADSGTEAAGGSYARVRVQGTGAWNAPSNGATANTATITFPQASAAWGQINSVGIKDSSTSTGTDNLLYYGDLNSPRTVNNGDTFTFPAGDLDVSES